MCGQIPFKQPALLILSLYVYGFIKLILRGFSNMSYQPEPEKSGGNCSNS